MQLYDSRSRELQTVPNNKQLKIYLCGPTVYDDVHIGNIAPVIIFDFLIRYLKEKQIDYIYVHNITDIDDKIVAKAKELQVSEENISSEYEKRYLDILHKLNIITPTYMPKVSEHISEIQRVISELEKQGYTERLDGDIVFKLELISEYGELSKQNIQSLKNVSDFCLWKKMDSGKTWNSPWGEGRPGWHTECFAFIEKYLQGQVDIHGGGVDLKFPHHENENAHCRALHKQSLANIWMHVGHLTTDQGKISKSNNKKYLVKDLLKVYSANVIRLLFLTNTYSTPSLITDEKLVNLKKDWDSFVLAVNKSISYTYLQTKNTTLNTDSEIDNQLLSFLQQDLNLPGVLTWLHALKKDLLSAIKTKNNQQIQALGGKLYQHLKWLGFCIPNIHTPENLSLLDKWDNLINNKNWAEADKLRELLIQQDLI